MHVIQTVLRWYLILIHERVTWSWLQGCVFDICKGYIDCAKYNKNIMTLLFYSRVC